VIPSAEPATLAEMLRRQCAEALGRANRQERPVVVSLTVALPDPPDLVDFFVRGDQSSTYRAYWEQRAEGHALVGIGAARVIRCDGPGRFRDAARAIREDMATALIDDSIGAPGGPIYLGGFAFDPDQPATPAWSPYPAGLLVLPRLLLALRDGEASLTLNTLIEPNANLDAVAESALRDLAMIRVDEPSGFDAYDRGGQAEVVEEFPEPRAWKASVAASASDVRAGRFEKVVLARSVRLRAAESFDPARVLRRLRSTNPSATIFAIAAPGRCFLGATPEHLVRLAGRDVSVTCLAGSIARGTTDHEDERLARALLDSAKDRTEHEIVVRSTQEALAEVCTEVVRAPGTPSVARSRSVQHLETPLRGRLANGGCILDLVDRLHPTPAVGGYPRDVALEVIRERESMDRGWYAGPVGWVDRNGEGEFAVAIRSALLAGRDATLYAGAGIVADSDSGAEYAETCLKMEPMLAALGTR
jgi:menaquinone-specific isochorismate synthase